MRDIDHRAQHRNTPSQNTHSPGLATKATATMARTKALREFIVSRELCVWRLPEGARGLLMSRVMARGAKYKESAIATLVPRLGKLTTGKGALLF